MESTPETCSVALDTLTTTRARRALSHGGGIDTIVFLLLAAAGVGMLVVLIVAGLQKAETNATQAAHEHSVRMHQSPAEIGNP